MQVTVTPSQTTDLEVIEQDGETVLSLCEGLLTPREFVAVVLALAEVAA